MARSVLLEDAYINKTESVSDSLVDVLSISAIASQSPLSKSILYSAPEASCSAQLIDQPSISPEAGRRHTAEVH
jgi:hypothetical protein